MSNTTPLIYLAKGKMLYVLKDLFEHVYIKLEERPRVDKMLRGIHEGEIEVLLLAIELGADKRSGEDAKRIQK
ncbi:MAG: hypothetical protein KAU16_04265 [Methanophagales archaeon]|nr:hypothetical protein [Methanophagales archaeon]